jgi:fatty-acyl-CoA synthase
MRPRLWLSLISQNHATVSFGPPFGYELCVQRLREDTADQFDLKSWRLAVSARTIRRTLARFAGMLAPAVSARCLYRLLRYGRVLPCGASLSG